MIKLWIPLAVAIAIVVACFWFPLLESDSALRAATVQPGSGRPAAGADAVVQVANPASSKAATSGGLAGEPAFTEAALQEQLADVLSEYQQAAQYPPDSQPIANAAELQRYLPERPSSVGLPYPIEGQEEPIQLSLQLDKYQYFQGDPILAAVSLGGVPAGAQATAKIQLSTLDGQALLEQDMQPDGQQGNLHTAVLATSAGEAGQWPSELQVKAFVEVDGNRLFIAAPLRFDVAAAHLTGVGASQVQQEYLLIPLQLTVAKPGYFFVGANLYSQESGQPLVHLEGEQRLGGGSQQLTLRAHVRALRARGDEGPYLLKDFQIVRGAETGEPADQAGRASQPAYPVTGARFDSFEDRPWQDPLAQERAELLGRLGQ